MFWRCTVFAGCQWMNEFVEILTFMSFLYLIAAVKYVVELNVRLLQSDHNESESCPKAVGATKLDTILRSKFPLLYPEMLQCLNSSEIVMGSPWQLTRAQENFQQHCDSSFLNSFAPNFFCKMILFQVHRQCLVFFCWHAVCKCIIINTPVQLFKLFHLHSKHVSSNYFFGDTDFHGAVICGLNS